MINKDAAIKIATDYYSSKDGQKILKLNNSENMWIAFGGHDGKEKIGNVAIAISKKDGSISDFVLPSKENFAILKNSAEELLY